MPMYPPPTSQLPKIIPVVERIRLLLTTSEEYQRVALDVMDYPMATARKRQGIDPRPAVFIPGPQVIEVVVSVCAASTAADQVGQSSTRVVDKLMMRACVRSGLRPRSAGEKRIDEKGDRGYLDARIHGWRCLSIQSESHHHFHAA
jgi:hypothetical protein